VQSEKAAKNPYTTPHVNRLDFEQAAVFLVGHAYNNGDREAHALLNVMFPDPSQTQAEETLQGRSGNFTL
jgi:hypothetical protein